MSLCSTRGGDAVDAGPLNGFVSFRVRVRTRVKVSVRVRGRVGYK